MQTATLIDFKFPMGNDETSALDWADAFGRMPELPAPHQRWTVRRKAAVIEAVRGGWVPIEEVCRLYNLSVDEFSPGNATSTAMAFPACARPATRSTASPSCGKRRRSNGSSPQPYRTACPVDAG